MKSKELALEVREVSKRYGGTVAVDRLSLEVPRGVIYGLLGPNGAGKTTTLECIEALRTPDSGSMRVMGIDPVASPQRLWGVIGVQLQTSGLPETMTSREALTFFSRYHGNAPDFSVLDRFGLKAKANDQYVNLSTGQKRRLALALAVAHDPDVLFLDEPTAGLDVESRMELHSMMRELREAGKTIILATHDMAEAEKLCDTIAIIIGGRLAVTGTPSQITAAGDRQTRITISSVKGTVASRKPKIPDATLIDAADGYVRYHSENPARPVAALLSILENEGDELLDLRVERPTLEERFVEITRRNVK